MLLNVLYVLLVASADEVFVVMACSHIGYGQLMDARRGDAEMSSSFMSRMSEHKIILHQ